MEKFTYRNSVTVIGKVIDENSKFWVIETNEDIYTWEKSLTKVESIISRLIPATKKWLINEIRTMCEILGYDKTDSYYKHYFFGGVKESTLLSSPKWLFESHWKKLKNKIELYTNIA